MASVLAACCVIAVAIGMRIESANPPDRWLAAVKDYVDQTAVATDPAASVPHQKVNDILNRIGVHLDPAIGTPCVIGNRKGAHPIVSGDNGPVVVLIMPSAELPQTSEFKTTEIDGVLAPCPRGSIAVVGYADEPNGVGPKRKPLLLFSRPMLFRDDITHLTSWFQLSLVDKVAATVALIEIHINAAKRFAKNSPLWFKPKLIAIRNKYSITEFIGERPSVLKSAYTNAYITPKIVQIMPSWMTL